MINLKRGDTFIIQVQVKQDSTPIDITGWTVKSQLKKGSTLIETLTFTAVDLINGIYKLSATAAKTELWPISVLDCDIQYTTGTPQVISTDTFQVNVIKDITQ